LGSSIQQEKNGCTTTPWVGYIFMIFIQMVSGYGMIWLGLGFGQEKTSFPGFSKVVPRDGFIISSTTVKLRSLIKLRNLGNYENDSIT